MSPPRACVLLSPVLPDPHGSGLEQRAHLWLRDLAAKYRVTLVVCSTSKPSPTPEVERLVYQSSWIPGEPRRAVSRRIAMLFPPLLRFHPDYANDWPVATRNLAPLPPDIELVVCFRMRMHGVKGSLFNGHPERTLLDMDDLESRTRGSIAAAALRRGKIWLALTSALSAWQYSQLERTVAREYDCVTMASPVDVGRLAAALGAERVSVFRNRVRVEQRLPVMSAAHQFTLGFIGTLNYFPNEDAVLWLCEDVAPRLRKHLRRPFRLLIAGRGASPELQRRLERVPEIVFLGEVQDPALLYGAADVIVATVRCGGGTKVKLLEAMAFGRPVVATPHAAEGLPFLPGEDFVIAASADAIARQCAKLADDPHASRAMAIRAYERIKASEFNVEPDVDVSIKLPCSST